MFISGGIVKENVVSNYNGFLFGYKKKNKISWFVACMKS